MIMSKWTVTEPGTLVLEGTDFRIVYEPPSNPVNRLPIFNLYQGAHKRAVFMTLNQAKNEAERILTELIEMGIVQQ